tara:strand:+ start:439 stop:696 length:258 start_codon:yes stop_codon:yes gene_type:complete
MEKELKEFISFNKEDLTAKAVEDISKRLLLQFVHSLKCVVESGKFSTKTTYGRKNDISDFSNDFARVFYESFQDIVLEEIRKGEK